MGAVLIISIFLGFVPATIAKLKGKSFLAWYVYGVALFIVAIIHAIIIQPSEEFELMKGSKRLCPSCAEIVKSNAKICFHCKNQLTPLTDKDLNQQIKKYTVIVRKKNKTPFVFGLVIIIISLLLIIVPTMFYYYAIGSYSKNSQYYQENRTNHNYYLPSRRN